MQRASRGLQYLRLTKLRHWPRLARYFIERNRPAQPLEIWLKIAGLKVLVSPKNLELAPFTQIFIDKVYEQAPGFDLENPDNRVILDIGANVGFYGLKALLSNPKAVVHMFEPNPTVFQRLRANITANGFSNRAVLYQCALWHSQTDMALEQQGPSILARVSDMGIPIKCARLDSFEIGEIDLMKIDVEGAEVEMLKGARQTLGKTKRVVVERHSRQKLEQVREFLRQMGFIEVFYTSGICFFVRDQGPGSTSSTPANPNP